MLRRVVLLIGFLSIFTSFNAQHEAVASEAKHEVVSTEALSEQDQIQKENK